jgi:hypothetical protein
MKVFFKTNRLQFFLIVILSCTISYSFASEIDSPAIRDTVPAGFDIKNASFLLPQPLAKGKYSSALYLLNVVLPADWTHDIIKAPMFSYAAKYTLPKGFNIQGSISTLFVSNRINLGPFWNYSVDNVHFGVGYQVAFNYGMLKEFGFSTTLTGWEQQPSLTVGYSFKTMAITMRGDLYYTNAFNITEGGNKITYDNGYVNGYSVTTSLEQRLWKNRVMSFGVKINYLRYHILAWPAFPVNQYKYVVPEFQLGLNF